jgi:hypothetical protein
MSILVRYFLFSGSYGLIPLPHKNVKEASDCRFSIPQVQGWSVRSAKLLNRPVIVANASSRLNGS